MEPHLLFCCNILIINSPSYICIPEQKVIHFFPSGGGLIKSHFWLEIPLKLDHQTIQIKVLVCDSKCPYVHVLPGKTGLVSLTLRLNKTSFTPQHTITSKGVAYIKPFDSRLPFGLIEIELKNNHCCIEIHNTSDTTVEFLHGQEMAYLDARSKGLVQMNNSKHFLIDQYLHDRMTPATLSPMPLAYEKPIHPTQMSCITTHTELLEDDTNKSTSDNKYPWLEADEIRRNMTNTKIL